MTIQGCEHEEHVKRFHVGVSEFTSYLLISSKPATSREPLDLVSVISRPIVVKLDVWGQPSTRFTRGQLCVRCAKSPLVPSRYTVFQTKPWKKTLLRPTTRCPWCKQYELRRSRRRNIIERFLSLALLPCRCRSCGRRGLRPRWLSPSSGEVVRTGSDEAKI